VSGVRSRVDTHSMITIEIFILLILLEVSVPFHGTEIAAPLA